MAKHQNLSSPYAVHPFAFSSNADPANDGSIDMAPYKGWVNTGSSNTLKVRNATNTAWEDVSVAGAATTPAFGSNSNSVAVGNVGGASTLASRADHVHLGVRSLAHTSNTFSGPVILTASGGLGITSPSSGTFNFFAPTASAGGAGATNLDGLSDVAKATSMPGSPATNDLVFRTDLGLFFYYDGTRWLSTTLFTLDMTTPDAAGIQPLSANGTMGRVSLWHTDFAIWLVSLYGETFVATTNDGTKFWTAALAGAVTATAYGNFTTAAQAADTHTGHKTALNQAAGATERGMTLTWTKTSTPGAVYWGVKVTYRLIGT